MFEWKFPAAFLKNMWPENNNNNNNNNIDQLILL
jgi:hypothetical protein